MQPVQGVALAEHERTHLAALLRRLPVGMVATRDAAGRLHARPMAHHGLDERGRLWFFTRAESGKVEELAGDGPLAVSFADPRRRRYLSLSGRARIERDPERARRLWSWGERNWFPGGPEDPRLALVVVEVDSGEEWRARPRLLVRALGWLSARLRGRPCDLTRHRRYGG